MLFVVYGSNSVHLNDTESPNATCPSCGTKGSIVLSVFRRHAHVFWIPLFPMGKTGGGVCQHCKHTMKKKELPEEAIADYERLKSETGGPLWQFAGLAIIGALVVYFGLQSMQENKNEKAFLAEPAAGDVYEYKIENERFSTMKVVDITSDSVFVSHNVYEINKKSEVGSIDQDSNYTDYIFGIAPVKLQAMYDDGDIFDIVRE